MRQLDSKVTEKRPLDIYIFNVQKIEGKEFNSHYEELEYLNQQGFHVNPVRIYCKTMQEIKQAIEKIGEDRENLTFGIDGAVVKVDDLRFREILGTTAKTPRWAVAYKYPPEKKETTLKDIVFQVGRTGVITPMAILEPVKVAGSTISKTTLHNEDFVKEKGFNDLINAYKMLPAEIRSRFKLVIAGNADHADRYSDSLHKLGNETEGVIMPGFVRGEVRHQLLSHAALFAMPSYHEGLPIALLEALSYHLDVAVSNIPANCIDPLCRFSDFYQVGDTEGLASLINKKLSDTDAGKPARRNYNLAPYNWDNIAASTVELYRTLL